MNIFVWIFLALFCLSLILFSIFYSKNLTAPKRVFEILLFPFAACLTVFSIIQALPDSLNIIILSIHTYVFYTICTILFFFDTNKKCRVLGRIAFLCGILSWIMLFKSTFYIYNVSLPVLLISSIIYIAIIIFTFIYLGKQALSRYFWTLISIGLGAFLHFCAIVTIIEDYSLSALFLLFGTTGFLALTVFYLIFYKKEQKKHSKLIQTLLLILSQVFISLSCYLMIC